MNLTFITGNEGKVRELGLHFDHPVSHQKLDIEEIQSLDLRTVATEKARAAYAQLGSPVLVEDVGLTFHALGALPGPLIKWFLEELGNDGLVKLLDQQTDRSCTAAVCYALCDETGVQVFEGQVPGTVADTPRGTGFGWGPIFIPDGYTETWGEMNQADRMKTSMRRIALTQLKEFLDQAK